jgi:8-amino-7-oxononanoate synthase
MRAGLKDMGFDTLESETPIIPVLVRKASVAVEMSKKLLARGIFVSAIRPPTVPAHTARLRVTVTAAHMDEDIDACLEAFRHARG